MQINLQLKQDFRELRNDNQNAATNPKPRGAMKPFLFFFFFLLNCPVTSALVYGLHNQEFRSQHKQDMSQHAKLEKNKRII